MLVLICGDRNWTDAEMIREAIFGGMVKYGLFTVVHGDCRGADRIAGEEARKAGLHVVSMPARWAVYGSAAGPIRNRAMLELKPNRVWAFHDDIDASKGTRDMARAAGEAGVPVVYFDHAKLAT
jgi:hypothetical protein